MTDPFLDRATLEYVLWHALGKQMSIFAWRILDGSYIAMTATIEDEHGPKYATPLQATFPDAQTAVLTGYSVMCADRTLDRSN